MNMTLQHARAAGSLQLEQTLYMTWEKMTGKHQVHAHFG
jgi:hypothetical protein